MDKDRAEICRIVSEMLDNPGECEIYPTTVAYNKLELYVEKQRMEAAGWMQAECCTSLDRGEDPRQADVAELISRMEQDLA